MPLNPDIEGIVSAFRGTRFDPVQGKKRGTRGIPQKAALLTAEIFKKIAKQNPDRLNLIIEKWDNLIPTKFRNKCAPKNVRGNILYATSLNSSVRQELTFVERGILEKLKKIEGCEAIKKIRFQ